MGVPNSKPGNRPEPVVVTFNYGSINGYGNYHDELDAPTHEALIVGTSLGGRMSAVRRFFCLLTTFDLLFTLLVWFISAMNTNPSIKDAFESEVVDYTVHRSLFDIVMMSAIRFTMIILAYALFRLAHYWVVAVTTAGSGAFIIAKVFLFDWQHGSQYMPIVLLMCSFILSWGEAWFLDFRVVPYEDKASLLLARQINTMARSIPSGRNSPTPPSEDECTFYSPLDSGEESENEDHDVCEPTFLSPEEKMYKQLAESSLDESLAIISSDNWRTEKVSGSDIVQSKVIPVHGKVFKFVGNLNISAAFLLEEMFDKFDRITTWNPTVQTVKQLQRIDSSTDVVYILAAEGGGGLVKSRDFVNVRTWQKRGESLILSMIAAKHSTMPPFKHYIRGEQGPSAYVLMAAPGDSSKCQMQWLLITHLKGWIPQYLIDKTIATVMLDYVTALRNYTSSGLECVT